MATTEAQRERAKRLHAQRERYLADRAKGRGETNVTVPVERRATFHGHPLHALLIVIPLGLLATSIVFDVIHLFTNRGTWASVSFFMLGAGVLSGVVAAITGLIDWSAIPSGNRAKALGLWHGVGNIIVIGLFAVSWVLRDEHARTPSTLALVISLAGLTLAILTGGLGGELVERTSVGVEHGSNLKSSPPLSARTVPARSDDDLATAVQHAQA